MRCVHSLFRIAASAPVNTLERSGTWVVHAASHGLGKATCALSFAFGDGEETQVLIHASLSFTPSPQHSRRAWG